MESGLGLLMGEHSYEDVKQSIEFCKEIVSDLENMDISILEILEKLEKRTGRTAKEFERDTRIQFSKTYQEVCGLLESFLLELENN